MPDNDPYRCRKCGSTQFNLVEWELRQVPYDTATGSALDVTEHLEGGDFIAEATCRECGAQAPPGDLPAIGQTETDMLAALWAEPKIEGKGKRYEYGLIPLPVMPVRPMRDGEEWEVMRAHYDAKRQARAAVVYHKGRWYLPIRRRGR